MINFYWISKSFCSFNGRRKFFIARSYTHLSHFGKNAETLYRLRSMRHF